MSDSIASPQLPLQNVIPSYAYQQYADDDNIQAFISAYNQLTQGYLNWFNSTPLALYTSPNVTGQLLDWIGNGIYGIPRPVFSSLTTFFRGTAINNFPIDVMDIDGSIHSESGTAVLANDDFYKRTLTWHAYIGNGRMCNATVLRLRIARFLYGVNGTDITLSQAQNVSITVDTGPAGYDIVIPSSANPASTYFQQAFQAGLLAFPFMLAADVSIV